MISMLQLPSCLPVSLFLLLLTSAAAGHAQETTSDSGRCMQATAAAELATGVPDQLLGAISRVETGRYDPSTGTTPAWPWTINAQGVGHYYADKAEAVAAAKAFQDAGIRSIDVGCMQINLMYHPNGFASLDQAFDPTANSTFAARFLTDLFRQTGSWPHAAAAYHSQTPELGVDYQRKVLEAWAEPTDQPRRIARGSGPPPHMSPSPSPPGGSMPVIAAITRPLGGFGHIIRNNVPAGPGLGTMGVPMGSLAAYRARPIALLSFPYSARQ